MKTYTISVFDVGGDEAEHLTVQVETDMLELLCWWIKTAAADFSATVPKLEEYGGLEDGASDVREIGRDIADLLGWNDAPNAVLDEMGIYFYTKGKVARLRSNYRHHRVGKYDSWFDLTIYSLMARRMQDNGQWP